MPAQRGGPVHAEQFGDGQRDGDVLLEGDPAETAQLLVGDRLRVDRDQAAPRRVGLLLQDVQPVPLGGDADPADRHGPATASGRRRPASGPSRRGGPRARCTARRWWSGSACSWLTSCSCGHHRHALDHQRVRPVRGGPPDDADLLDDVGDAELAVDRLLGGVGVDEPGRGAGGLGDTVPGRRRAARRRTAG